MADPASNDTTTNITTLKTSFPLPPILHASSTPSTLLTQGAEGRLYQTSFLSRSCALKHRPSKPYRHALLDARLTRHRILSEARILHKCAREGLRVPALYYVDEGQGVLVLEWVAGDVVRVVANRWLEGRGRAGVVGDGEGEEDEMRDLLRRVGLAVGKLHKVGIVHGDLTTSNMMLRPSATSSSSSSSSSSSPSPPPTPSVSPEEGENTEKNTEKAGPLDGEIVMIDFGLASQGSADEDRAVDLYVLERAFMSTHPRAEALFAEVLEGYRGAFKGAGVVLRRLEDVRMRGRKRSMIG